MTPISWLLFAISGAEATYALSSGPLAVNGNGPCSPNPAGTGPQTRPDTVDNFVKNPVYQKTSVTAKTPAGFVRSFANLHAVSYNKQIVTQTVKAYDPQICADLCSNMQNCASFNIYYVRNPEVNPAFKCPNPASLTNINCRFSTVMTTSYDATFSLGKIASFDIVVAGSNGYNVNTKAKSSSSSAMTSTSAKTSSSVKVSSSSKSSSLLASTSAPKSSSSLVSSSAQKSSSAPKSSSSSGPKIGFSFAINPSISKTSSMSKSSSVPASSSSVRSIQATSSSLQTSSIAPSSSSTPAPATSSAVSGATCPASDHKSYIDSEQETYTIYCSTGYNANENSFQVEADTFEACIGACSKVNQPGSITCTGVTWWARYSACYGRSFTDQGSFTSNDQFDSAILNISLSSSGPASSSVQPSQATSSSLQISSVMSSSSAATSSLVISSDAPASSPTTSSASSTASSLATSSSVSGAACPASDHQSYVDSDQETYTIYCSTGYNGGEDSFAIKTDTFEACIGACSKLNQPGNTACTGVTYWPGGASQGANTCYGRSFTDQGSFFANYQFNSAVLQSNSSASGVSSSSMISSSASSIASSSSVASSVASSTTPTGPACTSQGVEFAFYDNTTPNQDNDANYTAFDPATYKTITPRSDDVGVTSTIFVDYNKDPLYGVSDFNQGAFVINHRGYFYAEQTGNYLFRALASDDATWIWVGDKAYSGWTKDNADVFANWARNRNYDSASTNISMVAGQTYPFRVLYAQAIGDYYMWFEVDGPDGKTIVDPQIAPYQDITTGCAGSSVAPPFPAFGQET